MKGMSLKKESSKSTVEDIWYLGSVGISRLFFSQSCNQEMSVTGFHSCVEFAFSIKTVVFPHNLLLIISAFRKDHHLFVTVL